MTKKGEMSSSEKQKIVAIMKAITPAYLATCDGDQPRVRAVSPIVEDNMSIWVTTFSTSRKVKQIKQNPEVSLAFVQPDYGGKSERTAIVVGEAEIITRIDEKKRIWKLWSEIYPEHKLESEFPNGPESNEFCLLKIIVKNVEWGIGWPKEIYEPKKQKVRG